MKITEVTTPYERKLVDPALMTTAEYIHSLNKDNRHHPYTAYDFKLKDMQKSYLTKENFPILVNRVKVGDETFEIRMNKEDRWEGKYVKYIPNTHEIERDESGHAIYMSPEEVRNAVKRRWECSFAMYNNKGETVASVQDEWGALLIVVAEEYRLKGLGSIMTKLALQYNPEKSSGGFTSRGETTFRKVHANMVKDYLKQGVYSMLVRTGQITLSRVQEIVRSVEKRNENK